MSATTLALPLCSCSLIVSLFSLSLPRAHTLDFPLTYTHTTHNHACTLTFPHVCFVVTSDKQGIKEEKCLIFFCSLLFCPGSQLNALRSPFAPLAPTFSPLVRQAADVRHLHSLSSNILLLHAKLAFTTLRSSPAYTLRILVVFGKTPWERQSKGRVWTLPKLLNRWTAKLSTASCVTVTAVCG